MSTYLVRTSTPDPYAPADDCNCACATPAHAAPPAQPDWHALVAQVAQFERVPGVQALALEDGFRVVFVPSHSRVALLNDATWALLARFVVPHPVGDTERAAQDALAHLWHAGLLQVAGTPPPAPTPSDELAAWLHVTNACNLRCTYCYVAKDDTAMTADTGYAAVNAVLRSARAHGYQRVLLKFAGGEASLNLPLVRELYAYARAQCAAAGLGLRGVVLSNGVLLTTPRLQAIKEAGLDLMISLDGDQPTHDAQRPRLGGQGSYHAVCAAIERAKAQGVRLTVSVTVTGQSAATLPTVVAWLLHRGIHFTLNFYRDNDCSASDAALQLDEHRLIAGMRAAYAVIGANLPAYSLLGCLLDRTNAQHSHQRTCGVGDNYLVVAHDGAVAKCQMAITAPVTTVYAADPLAVVQADQIGVQNLPASVKSGCRDCCWRYWCSGGCAIATYRATGRYDVQSPLCGVYRALYPDVLRLEGLRLLHHYRAQRAAP